MLHMPLTSECVVVAIRWRWRIRRHRALPTLKQQNHIGRPDTRPLAVEHRPVRDLHRDSCGDFREVRGEGSLLSRLEGDAAIGAVEGKAAAVELGFGRVAVGVVLVGR